MRRAAAAWVLAWGLAGAEAPAQGVVQDDFEAGTFSAGWNVTTGIATGSGAVGTARYAIVPSYTNVAGRQLGARFDAVAASGATAFEVDAYLRVSNTTDRQFNLMVSTDAGAISSSGAAINLRHQSNAWWVFSGTWQPVAGLPGVAAGPWYRLRVTGTNWGVPSASYAVQLSDAGGTNFTSAANGLTAYQSASPTGSPARFFVFTTQFGNNPGFDVDQVQAAVLSVPAPPTPDAVLNISGTYPHLTVFSAEGEIGMGAVAPWADRLWFVTYPPHVAGAGTDKLWTLDTNLTLVARPESVGGTHANRMIHRETQQLSIGPYLVDATGGVRVIPRAALPGRLTATARHPTDPTNQILIATMEEGFYAVDVNTLAVTTLKADAQTQTSGAGLLLAGNHGKGCYTGQGRVLYANNGEPVWAVGSDLGGFSLPAGLLTENTGTDFSNGWSTLERKNFTEITGPGGIYGATNDADAIWALGWDKRSVLLKLLDGGAWSTFRLPKGSYTHDSFQGWYTEWPRIREVQPGTLLMHMHGLFYTFPKTFRAAQTTGITPLCTYLKMPVDYCGWNGQIVMGRDDASTTGGNIWAGQSHSAPWFGQLSDLEQWGAPAGFGGPWKDDAVTNGVPGEPFFVAGFERRVLHLSHGMTGAVSFTLAADLTGAGGWSNVATISVSSNRYAWYVLPAGLAADWVRLTPAADATNVTAYFHLSNPPTQPDPALFVGLVSARTNAAASAGILRPRSGNARFLEFAASRLDGAGAVVGTGYYEIGGPFDLIVTNNPAAEATLRGAYSLSNANFAVDAASVVYTEGTNRFRLPKTLPAYDAAFSVGWPRGVREVVTERSLLNAHGTFYELPAAGSGGFRRIRPVATHRKRISDFASWRGLFVMAGVADGATNDGHVFRSADGQVALWYGGVDDLWRMGVPEGTGGPWRNTVVTNGVPSDPYLMLGYERKELTLSHGVGGPVTFTLEVDVAADNRWSEYARFTVAAGQTLTHLFPEGYAAHWVRLKSDTTAAVTAQFDYTAAAPGVAGLARGGVGDAEVTVRGLAGQSYTLWATTNLWAPRDQWQAVTSGVLTAASGLAVDPAPGGPGPRFYAVTVP